MAPRTTGLLMIAAGALFLVAGTIAVIGDQGGTSALYFVAGALFVVVGILRSRPVKKP